MNISEKISGKFYRTFVFTDKLKQTLLRTLSLQVKKGVTIKDFFTMLHDSTDDLTLRAIAKTAKDSMSRGRPFATDFALEGYFIEDDAKLLIAAEKAGTIPEVVELLLAKEDQETSFLQVVIIGNLNWILAIAVLIIITIAGRSQEKLASAISGGIRADFFILGEILDNNIFTIVVSLCSILAIYLVGRSMILGKLRNQLKEIGIFKFHDMKSAESMCRLFAAICKTNAISPVDMLRLGRDVSKGNPFLFNALQKCIDDMSEGLEPIDSIGRHLLSKNSALQLKLMTPNKKPEEMANAFEAIAESTQQETKWVLSSMSQVTGYFLMITTLLLAYPLMEISMGATITV